MNDAAWRSPAARAQRVALGLLLVLGALDAWFFQHWNVNPDGVSYLDLARAFAAHGPSAVVSGYRSPLFPALPAHCTASCHRRWTRCIRWRTR